MKYLSFLILIILILFLLFAGDAIAPVTDTPPQEELSSTTPTTTFEAPVVTFSDTTSDEVTPDTVIDEETEQQPIVDESEEVGALPDPTPVRTSEDILLQEVNPIARQALVNVTCELRSGNSIRRTTGSGIVIDEKGVILTNAHVVYLYLLDEAFDADAVACGVRTGNPATPRYLAEPLYISQVWIEENSEKLAGKTTTGTGEHDYALLLITESLDDSPLPSSFPALDANLTDGSLDVGDDVLTIAYPAEFLFEESIAHELYLTSDVGTVSKMFTFGANTFDLVTVSGSILAQRGASGGAIVDSDARLAGLIVTSSKHGVLTDREVGALTLSYISLDLEDQIGETLSEFIGHTNLLGQLTQFEKETAPRLRDILKDAFKEHEN